MAVDRHGYQPHLGHGQHLERRQWQGRIGRAYAPLSKWSVHVLVVYVCVFECKDVCVHARISGVWACSVPVQPHVYWGEYVHTLKTLSTVLLCAFVSRLLPWGPRV